MIQPKLIRKFNWTTPGDIARICRAIITESSKSFEIRSLLFICAHDGNKKYDNIDKLIHFLKSRFIFVRDPDGIEYVKSPTYQAAKLLNGETITGDCDDITCLVLALGKAMGYDGFMVFVSPKGFKMPYTHVLPALLTPLQKVIPIELTTEIENMRRLKPIAVMRV